ncbi:GapS4b family protein [Chryseobacterium indologenes]|uniref:GapS4b family protein n=1 Tax=Chryseobacterium indologenes TaxID=253 RepID=UPI001627B391|nr:hypothetical protein [Chryseobacterium indologenes]
MRHEHKEISKILPYGELLRGFANQGYLVKSDLKRFLRDRGIFFNTSEKEFLVPCVSTLLLSPSEFDELREYQNTKEDNYKKNTSRINCSSDFKIMDALDNINFANIIPKEGVSFRLFKEPTITINPYNKDKATIEYEIERNDLNKSWYESTNIFKGEIEIEKISDTEIKLTKSYTSNESNFVGENILKCTISHFKEKKIVEKEQQLKKILFSDFENADRIIFFYRLSANMQDSVFQFKDIVNLEFRPEIGKILPSEIDWMLNKSELKIRGKQIHDTFFIKDNKFHENLQFWEIESSFTFKLEKYEGTCNIVFGFRDYLIKGDNAEFELNISNFSLYNGSEYSSKDKLLIKNKLLRQIEKSKDLVYTNFLNYIKEKEIALK